jgi:YegS/Rv2252/BmrU family lipid kinase
MRTKYLFVVNPISGDYDKGEFINKIKDWGKSLDHDILIWKTTGEKDHDKLKKQLQLKSPQVVVSVGGDGTLLLCAAVVKNTELKLGIIAAGSANGMATELNIPDSVDEALQILNKAKTQKTDLLKFNSQQFGLHISDMGLNALLVKSFDQSDKRGLTGYASEVLEVVKKAEKFKAELVLENKTIERECLMIAFANARTYGTGAILNQSGKTNDGLFEVCILKELSITKMAGHFLEALYKPNNEHLEVHQVRSVTVKTEKPVSFQVDGEPLDDTTLVKVEILEACLNLLVP